MFMPATIAMPQRVGYMFLNELSLGSYSGTVALYSVVSGWLTQPDCHCQCSLLELIIVLRSVLLSK